MTNRKCSFRFLYLDDAGLARVITQDLRRRKRFVTGHRYLGLSNTEKIHDVARKEGCSVVIRYKAPR